jgi:DNA-binding transcriptional LysR family regulator
MRHVTLRQLQVFAAVARHLSFSKAAPELHLTQPAVSMQIRQLEEAAGMPLFERVGRRTSLTEAGRELLARANGVNELLREAQESLEALRGMKAGTLKLGAVSTAKYFAPSLLADFTPAYPGVTVRFNVANREEIVKQLAENDIDLAIMGRPPRELETIAVPFAKHALIIIATPDHPLAKKRRIPLKRLESERFLIREQGSGTRASMERVFRERGVHYRASMEVSSNETIKQAVIAGMGISFISIHTVGLELQTGRLLALDVVGLPEVRDWYVIHLRDKRLTPITAAFREFLLKSGAGIIERATGISLPVSRAANVSVRRGP